MLGIKIHECLHTRNNGTKNVFQAHSCTQNANVYTFLVIVGTIQYPKIIKISKAQLVIASLQDPQNGNVRLVQSFEFVLLDLDMVFHMHQQICHPMNPMQCNPEFSHNRLNKSAVYMYSTKHKETRSKQ